MKYLIFIGLFVGGGLVGYYLGFRQYGVNTTPVDLEPERITEFVYDTIVERETVEVPVPVNLVDTASVFSDTLEEELELDTITEFIQPRDSLIDDEDLQIRRDEMIASRKIPVVYLDLTADKDSVMKDLLGIKESRIEEMVVQFWRSPIGFSGYKLSKATLVVYGLADQYEYIIYNKDKQYYLAHENIFYALQETTEFLPFKEVPKARIIND